MPLAGGVVSENAWASGPKPTKHTTGWKMNKNHWASFKSHNTFIQQTSPPSAALEITFDGGEGSITIKPTPI